MEQFMQIEIAHIQRIVMMEDVFQEIFGVFLHIQEKKKKEEGERLALLEKLAMQVTIYYELLLTLIN